MKLDLWLSMDVPDTDLAATLYEVRPTARASSSPPTSCARDTASRSARRSRCRPGAIQRYEFSGFPFFSRRIGQGSRLRLLVASPNTRMLQKNYNSGGIVADETAKDARTAHMSLHHDPSTRASSSCPSANRARGRRPANATAQRARRSPPSTSGSGPSPRCRCRPFQKPGTARPGRPSGRHCPARGAHAHRPRPLRRVVPSVLIRQSRERAHLLPFFRGEGGISEDLSRFGAESDAAAPTRSFMVSSIWPTT